MKYIKRIAGKWKEEIDLYVALRRKDKDYVKKFKKYSFWGNKCNEEKQYEAVITRWQHTIEKGLSYIDYRPGFGKANMDALLTAMENYVADGYSTDAFFFKTALSTIISYISRNKEYGIEENEIESRINAMGGTSNGLGGVLRFSPPDEKDIRKSGYEEFAKSRHSMRHFSDKPVMIDRIKNAVQLAQYTPSACNRQGWRTIVISDKNVVKQVCSNQNGNRGFGQEFDKMLLVTADLRYFNRDRELFQAFIDGGMYAQNILNALHYEHIASVPLSVSLQRKQENNIRRLLHLHDAEILILLIGIGNYPDICQTARSERHPVEIEII